MNNIPAQEIERRGMSALNDLLRTGPVQVVENDHPRCVVLAAADYERLTAGPSVWDWLARPSRTTREKAAIDADLDAERAAWDRCA